MPRTDVDKSVLTEPDPSGIPDLVNLLREVYDALVEEFESKPTMGELLEVLEVASCEYFASTVTYRARLSGRRRYSQQGNSRVGYLNDAAFVSSVDLLRTIDPQGAERGAPRDDIGPMLLAACRDGRVELSDVSFDEISSISVTAKSKQRRAKIGDLISVPSGVGGYYLGVALERNRWGLAMGFLVGTVSVPRVPFRSEAKIVIHTDEEGIREGTWKIIANVPDLVSLFPDSPIIYHDGSVEVPGIDYGEFGLAENSAGDLWKIDREEASRVGLLDGTYRQSRMSEEIASYLDSLTD